MLVLIKWFENVCVFYDISTFQGKAIHQDREERQQGGIINNNYSSSPNGL